MKFDAKRILLLALAALALCSSCSRVLAPGIGVTSKGPCARLDMRWLGEYGISVDRIALREGDEGPVVWGAEVTQGRGALAWVLDFCVGENATTPAMGIDARSFRFTARTGDSYQLTEGVRYVVDVHSPNYRRTARRRFVLTNASSSRN